MNKVLSTVAIATLSGFMLPSLPARSNPAIPAAVTACLSNPYCTATMIWIGGVAYWQIQHAVDPKNMPLAPMVGDPGNVQGVQETHGAVNRSDCKRMEEMFRKQGRNVTLKQIIPSNNQGASLRFICVFEGPDATVGYYDRYRR